MSENPEMAIKKAEVVRRAARRRCSEMDARVVLDALKASGRSLIEFARKYDLDPQRLRRWQSRFEETGAKADSDVVSFAPVVVRGLGRSAIVIARMGEVEVEVEVVDPARVDPRWVAGLLDAVISDGRGDC